MPGIGSVGHAGLVRRLPDPSQDDRRVALERRSSAHASFDDHRLERGREAIGRKRRRSMIVDHATSRCLECAGEGRDALDHVVIDERVQLRRLVLLKEAVDEKNICDWRSLRSRMPCMSSSTSCCCWRTATGGGCSRAVARYAQSAGHGIWTRRFVPQHTAQICWPSAGQPRLARRVPHRGQAMCAVLYNRAEKHAEFIGTTLAVARGVCRR